MVLRVAPVSTALIDADVIVHRSAAAAEFKIDWEGDGNVERTVSDEQAAETAIGMTKQWVEQAGCTEAILCFSHPVRFRQNEAVYPPYKTNRTAIRPAAFQAVVAALEKHFRFVRLPWLEADDVMGILSTAGKVPDPVVVSIDKDLASIPGRLFNPMKDNKPRRITPYMADVSWLRQTLTGDPGDGFYGVPGIGPKKADKILEAADGILTHIWDAIVATYESKDMSEEDAIRQARCARILRAPDYDSEKGIRLWHPRDKNIWLAVAIPPTPPVPASSSFARARNSTVT